MTASSRCIWLHRPVELHGRTTLLDDFSVLSMQASLLVLFHSSNFFFESLLGTFVLIGIACRRQAIGKGGFFLEKLPSAHVGAYDGGVANDFRAPNTINQSFYPQNLSTSLRPNAAFPF